MENICSHLGHARLPGGDQQLFVYALEFLFGEPSLGDVFDHRETTQWLAARSDHSLCARHHGVACAVRPDYDELGVTHCVTEQRSRQRTILTRHRRSTVRPIDLGRERVGIARYRVVGFFSGNSKQFGRGAVVVRDLPPDVAGNQRNREFGDDGGEQCLVLQQGGCHLLARGNVDQKFDRALRLPATAAYERRGRMNPKRAAVLAQVALLHFQVSNLSAPQPPEACGGGLQIRRVREARHRLALELLAIEAKHGAVGPIAVPIAALTVGKSNADRCTLDRIAEQRLHALRVDLRQQSVDLRPGNASICAVHPFRPDIL